MKQHVGECGFRPIRCLSCELDDEEEPFEGTQAEVVKHLGDEHNLALRQMSADSNSIQFTGGGGGGVTGQWERVYHWKERYFYFLASPYKGGKDAMQFQLFIIEQSAAQSSPCFTIEVKSRGKHLMSKGAVLDFRDYFNVADANEALLVDKNWLYWLCDEKEKDSWAVIITFRDDDDIWDFRRSGLL